MAVFFKQWLTNDRINLVKAYFLGQGWYLGDGHSSKPGPSKGFQLDPKGLWIDTCWHPETEPGKAPRLEGAGILASMIVFSGMHIDTQNGNKNDKVAVQLR